MDTFFFWGDDNVPELEGGNEKAIKLYTSKGLILWYMSYTSVKMQNWWFIKMAILETPELSSSLGHTVLIAIHRGIHFKRNPETR